MPPLSQPLLLSSGLSSYHCADIRSLYHWLEAHGYHYYGSFGPDEYGRFACEELALGDTGPIHHSSYIEVRLDGTVVAADEHAQQVLLSLVTIREFP
jgi:hypothetical protein